ncbi:MAG TPA: hypothetical protein VFV95_07475 [Vicinamibacterales bacterium]|nr:hypothetical protein [Vicinamibacterales bacterium]
MIRRAIVRIAAPLVTVLLAVSVPAYAQRFDAARRETVAAIPGLDVVTIRDTVTNSCYTLFILEPAIPRVPSVVPDQRSAQELADERDRRLAALLAEYERSQFAPVPGFPVPTLRYGWEGNRVQSEYEQRLRDKEFSRLEEQITRLAAAPRLAVAGPSSCTAPAAALKR